MLTSLPFTPFVYPGVEAVEDATDTESALVCEWGERMGQ